MDEETCAYCGNETCDGDTYGWVQDEFGWKCPECRVNNIETSAGVEGFAEVIGMTKANE